MLNSEKKYQVFISFNQSIKGVFLSLVDGSMNIVCNEYNIINLELHKGIYKLNARYIDYVQEYILIIDGEKDIKLDFNYPCVAPILSFVTTHKYYSVNAELYSKTTTENESNVKPNFLFFAAKYEKDRFQEVIMEELLDNYCIINCRNEILYQFNNENSKLNNEYGWLAFSRKFENGQYFLKWEKGNECRIFSFMIYENYQTQFFIRYTSNPDFENCLFFYTKKMGFSVESVEYIVLDKIQFAFKDYKNYLLLTDEDKSIIRQQPYLVSLVYILQSLLGVNKDFENFEKLELPDIKLINNENAKKEDVLPLLSSVMNRFSYYKTDMQLLTSFLIDRTIDHVRYDLFWNNFSKIDKSDELLDLYLEHINMHDLVTIKKNDNKVMKVSKFLINEFLQSNKETIEVKLKEIGSKMEGKILSLIKRYSDVFEIAEKLNLRPTKVLRNYKLYKEIYNKLVPQLEMLSEE